MQEIQKALTLKNELDNLRPINLDQEARIMQKFRLDWNFHSNHLEGNSLNYGETKALLLFGITAQGKPLKDHFEITGHNEAINWVIDMVKGERPLTESFIRELHKLLLKEPYHVDAITPDGKPTQKKINVGSYKTAANHVKTKTGEIFYFASPEETPSKMFDLLQWYDEQLKDKTINPLFLAANFHYKFIRIHPFDDGNGRTARILMNFILMQFGFPPIIIKTQDKDNYFAALQLADAGNKEAFITYIAKNSIHSLELMIAGAKGEEIEEEDDLDKEIALLEQKLSGFEEKKIPHSINKTPNKEYIKHLMFLVLNKFSENNFKFFILYEKSDFFMDIGNKIIHLKKEDFEKIFNDNFRFLYEKQTFIFEFTFKNLKKLNLDQSYYSNRVEMTFFTNYLELKINNSNIKEFYFKSDTIEKQIEVLVKSEVKHHKEFIEQKIAEKVNNNS